MTVPAGDGPSLEQGMLRDLQRLVEGIDLRAPRPGQPDEARIALEAAELRARALVLIHYIEDSTAKGAVGSD